MAPRGFPEHPSHASPLAPSRFPLSPPEVAPLEHVQRSADNQIGPRPWGVRFAVPAVIDAKHRKRQTHGVITKETKYIDDGNEHTDSIDEPYEDEVDEEP